MESENSCDWKEEKELPIFLGYDTFGKPLTLDLAESPNILAAGAYNQGGGVLLKSMLNSLLTAKNPGELRIMIADSQVVEFSEYENLDRSWFYGNGLYLGIQDNPTGQLEHLCREMDERFSKLREAGCNNIVAYHRTHGSLPYIVLIVNEYSNLYQLFVFYHEYGIPQCGHTSCPKRQDCGHTLHHLHSQAVNREQPVHQKHSK